MTRTAKLFMKGRSQAVRLPADYRFYGTEVFIRRDPETGDVILSRKPGIWDRLFALIDAARVPEDFLNNRGDETPQTRAPF